MGKSAPPLHQGEPIEAAPPDRREFGHGRSGAGYRDRFSGQNALHDFTAIVPEVAHRDRAHSAIVSPRETKATAPGGSARLAFPDFADVQSTPVLIQVVVTQ